ERQPCKNLEPSPERLLILLHGWRDEAARAGRTITRIALAFEAGRDGFWLARWLTAARRRGSRDPCLECGGIAGAIIAVVELSQSSWLVAGVLPGVGHGRVAACVLGGFAVSHDANAVVCANGVYR